MVRYDLLDVKWYIMINCEWLGDIGIMDPKMAKMVPELVMYSFFPFIGI